MKDVIISSVNSVEVYKYCIKTHGLTKEDTETIINLSDIKIIDFCPNQSLICAGIIYKNKAYGFVVGACEALLSIKFPNSYL